MTNSDKELDETTKIFTDLENSFILFLREDPTRTTSGPATLAAQHFEQRLNALIEKKVREITNACVEEVQYWKLETEHLKSAIQELEDNQAKEGV